MRRLIEAGLMFGNLIRVDSPVWIERYNRALRHLTGRETTLTDFHIDIAGFSPEIGDELGDPLYLNHDGVNRQFILLTTEQRRAPLLDARFSTSRTILRRFIEENEAQLFALTARDAVAGELVNSTYAVDSPARLFELRHVRIEADTTAGTVRTARRLGALIERFRTEEDAWWDDVLIAEMIALARETGDVVRNPVALSKSEFAQEDFWTALFGGIYVFRGQPHPAAISASGKAALGPLPIRFTFDLAERSAIARFLALNELVEPVVQARGIDGARILRQKMAFILAHRAAERGHPLEGATEADLRRLARALGPDLPAEWHALGALVRWAEEGGPWPRIDSENEAYFYTLRARPGPVADLVNMLLSELSPLDARQLFICHKDAFYRAYAGWPEAKRAFVADFLEREYLVDKAGARDALFGGDGFEPAAPGGDGPAARSVAPSPWGGRARPKPDLVDLVGPWGAVRRR